MTFENPDADLGHTDLRRGPRVLRNYCLTSQIGEISSALLQWRGSTADSCRELARIVSIRINKVLLADFEWKAAVTPAQTGLDL